MAEKHRRDSLNTNIVTMGELVPTVADSPRKMDKISIMRLAAAYLRVKYALGQGALDFLPRELGELDLEQFIIDNLIDSGGFFIVVTTTGKVVYVSQKIQDHLGHTQQSKSFTEHGGETSPRQSQYKHRDHGGTCAHCGR